MWYSRPFCSVLVEWFSFGWGYGLVWYRSVSFSFVLIWCVLSSAWGGVVGYMNSFCFVYVIKLSLLQFVFLVSSFFLYIFFTLCYVSFTLQSCFTLSFFFCLFI